MGLAKHFLAIQNITLDLSEIIKDAKNILEVHDKRLAKLTFPRALFILDENFDPEELVVWGSTQTNPPLYNGEMSLLLTQPPSQSSPPVNAPDNPYSPPLGPRKEASNADPLSSEGNLNEDRLTAANDKLFGAY